MVHVDHKISPQTQFLLDTAQIHDEQIEFAIEKQRSKSKGQRWCCAVCGTYITDDGLRVHINGAHEHFKINPQGQAFQFRSFSFAEGCSRTGPLIAEHTWYAGYLWQFVHCANCKIQLGWYFAGPEPFYGLIKQQILLCPEEKPQ
ncbi:cereblon family protein [Kaarinaea lacus]